MSPSISAYPKSTFVMQRRAFLAAVGAALMVSACANDAKQADESWAAAGTKTDPINHDVWDRILASYASAAGDGVNRVDCKAIESKAALCILPTS
jgi:hypothetical protein